MVQTPCGSHDSGRWLRENLDSDEPPAEAGGSWGEWVRCARRCLEFWSPQREGQGVARTGGGLIGHELDLELFRVASPMSPRRRRVRLRQVQRCFDFDV